MNIRADKLRRPPADDFRVVIVLPGRPNTGDDDTRGQLALLAEADGDHGRFSNRDIDEVAGDPSTVVDALWRPIAAEQRERGNRGEPLTHGLVELKVTSRRSERLLGPLQALLVDGDRLPTGITDPITPAATVPSGPPRAVTGPAADAGQLFGC